MKAFWQFIKGAISLLVWKVQLLNLERVAHELEVEEQLYTIREKIWKREEKQRLFLANFKIRGGILAALHRSTKSAQDHCNHHKGGSVSLYSGTLTSPGEDSQYSVVKHAFANGKVHVICIRCNKKWKPTDADQEAYKAACDFPTRNRNSSSNGFLFSDGGKHYDEALRNY